MALMPAKKPRLDRQDSMDAADVSQMNALPRDYLQALRFDNRMKEIEHMVKELAKKTEEDREAKHQLMKQLADSQERERAFESMYMIAMQVFAAMFGLNMSQFQGNNNMVPLFENEAQKMIYRQPSSPIPKSDASSNINKVVNIKATEEIRENTS